MKVFQWCKTDHVGNIHQYRPAWTTIQLQCNGSDASNVELPASEVIEVIEGYHQSSLFSIVTFMIPFNYQKEILAIMISFLEILKST